MIKLAVRPLTITTSIITIMGVEILRISNSDDYCSSNDTFKKDSNKKHITIVTTIIDFTMNIIIDIITCSFNTSVMFDIIITFILIIIFIVLSYCYIIDYFPIIKVVVITNIFI